MKKKIISLLTTLVMVVGLVGVMPVVGVSADTIGGYEYDILEDGTVEISHYYGDKTELEIPDTIDGKKVTSIGEWAFEERTELTSITIPDSVTSIGDWAFWNCGSLTSITIPDSVTSIGDSVFVSGGGLTSINVGDGNKNYLSSDGVLFNKNKTELICYPCGKDDEKYAIPNSVTSIETYAFADCTSLISITIPDSVTSIGADAFYYCTSLISITIPDSVISIGSRAFADCTSLTSVIIPDSVTSIEDCDFEGCTRLSSVTIPNSVTSIGDYAFRGCKSLTSITIPDSVTSIGDVAFIYCTRLTSVTIGNSVTSIGDQAFYDCDSLTSITIPSSVTEIGNYAFGYVSNKETWETTKKDNFKIYCYAGTAGEQYAIDHGFKYSLIYKIGTVSGFKTSSVSSSAVKLKWNKVSDAQGYIVYKYDNSKKTWVRAAKTKTTANTYTVSKLKSGTSYKFAVKAYKTVNGKEITSSKFPTVTAITLLPNATGFKTSSISSTAVKLKWNKVSDAQGYIVYKYDNSKKTWVRAAKTKTTANTYTVSKLKSGTSYKFAVKPYKTVNGKEVTSSKFPTVTAITKLPAVVNGATTVGKNSVKLTWKKTTGAQGYIVYKYNNAKKTWQRVAKTKSLSYLVKKLKSGTNYKFAVKAYKYVNKKEITSVSFKTISVKTKK